MRSKIFENETREIPRARNLILFWSSNDFMKCLSYFRTKLRLRSKNRQKAVGKRNTLHHTSQVSTGRSESDARALPLFIGVNVKYDWNELAYNTVSCVADFSETDWKVSLNATSAAGRIAPLS